MITDEQAGTVLRIEPRIKSKILHAQQILLHAVAERYEFDVQLRHAALAASPVQFA